MRSYIPFFNSVASRMSAERKENYIRRVSTNTVNFNRILSCLKTSETLRTEHLKIIAQKRCKRKEMT